MTDGEGNTTRYTYTLSGQLAKVTDALGNETEYQYDVCDRLIEIRQYGAEGSLKEEAEASGMDAELLEAERQNGRKRLCQITRYTRDLRGQVTETMDALGQKETYTYDKKGQLLGKLDKEGYLTKYAYTKQGDLSGIQYADGKEVKLSYNPLRQLIEIQDWLGSTRITPDALGRAEKVQYPDGREVSYTYGKAGERRSITYPDGTTVFYGYDEQFRLSELKEGDSIITYGYDPVGRLCEKQFPNGTKTTYRYDRKDQLTELLHQDQEGILDCYTYLYDLLGNKTGITKERRGLERESGQYRYGYDALGRLSEIQKDGEIQTRYGYDAFGNRAWKEESGERTSYQYNALNQMVSERQGEIRKEYGYDKRGNLTRILENGAWKKQYVYGAMNRLEEAVDAAGKQARYQYNGLGHRVGKQEGVLPKEKLEKLDPQRRVGMEIGNSRQITYTLDLTRQYYNLLERTEESESQRYFWDGNVAAYEENGERNYYLQDELGSPLRIEDSFGTIKENYGYGVFGEDLYQNQGEIQPFGYTGYQRDEIAGTYYAQAREYLAESGRFNSEDPIRYKTNYYVYCSNNPLNFIDTLGLKENACNNDSVDIPKEIEKISSSLRNVSLVERFTELTISGRLDSILEIFGFEKDASGVYHVRQTAWQKYFGYNDLYDWFFDAATDMKRKKFPFTTESGEKYIIWMWKGDYINLGVGAETGIYYGGEPHWKTGVEKALPMKLNVSYKGEEIINYKPTQEQWWITGFYPPIQSADADDIKVEGEIDFKNAPEEVWQAFYNKYGKSKKYEKMFEFDTLNKVVIYTW